MPDTETRLPLAITEFTKAGYQDEPGLLSKVIRLDLATGKPVSDGSQCRMSKGTARIVLFDNVSEFADYISSLPSDRAISLGVYDEQRNDAEGKVSVTTPRALRGGEIKDHVILRSKRYLGYSVSYAAFLCIDFDRKGMPAHVAAALDKHGGPWSTISALYPVLNDVASVGRGSTSSGIYNAVTGEKYNSGGGAHFYIAVKDALDIPRALVTIYDRAWLAGYGWHVYSSSGAVLERCIIDKSVRGAERLVFEGAPVLVEPLAQDMSQRKATCEPGEYLDTVRHIADLTANEVREVERIKRNARERFLRETRVERERIVAAYVKLMMERSGRTEKECRAALERIHGGILHPSDVLLFDNPDLGDKGKVSVLEILRNPEDYEGETLAHPGDEAYGSGKAVVFERRPGAGIVIHSLAHGLSTRFRCCWDKESAMAELAGVPDEVEPLLTAMERVAADTAGMTKAELMELLHHVHKRLKKRGLGVKDVKDRQASAAAAMRAAERRQVQDEADEVAGGGKVPLVEMPPPDAEVNAFLSRVENHLLDHVETPAPMLRTASGLLAHFEAENPGSTVQLFRTLPVCRSIGVVGCTDLQVIQKIESYVRFFIMAEDDDGNPFPRPVRLSTMWAAHYNAYDRAFLPQVNGVATLPVVNDGELVSKKGYDHGTGLMFAVPDEIQAVMPRPESVDMKSALAALRLLMDDLLIDVETDAKGKAVLIALGCTMIERHLLPRRPVFFVTASEAGGGKTTAVQLLALSIFGKALSVQAWKERQEEMEKALFSNLRVGPPAILFDNLLNGSEVRDPAIEMIATSPTYEGRVLGESRMEKVPATSAIVITGNNVRPVSDLATRSLIVKIDVKQERPGEREVQRENYEEWVDLHRGELLSAFMTILMLDTEEYTSSHRTRFPEWQRAVGDKIEVLMHGIGHREFNFGSIFAAAVEDDPSAEARRSFFTWMNEKLPKRFSAAELADLLTAPPKPDDLWMGDIAGKTDKWNQARNEVANRRSELDLAVGGEPLGFKPSAVGIASRLRALAAKPVRITENGNEIVVRLVRLDQVVGRDRGHLWEMEKMDGGGKAPDPVEVDDFPASQSERDNWNDIMF